jgi:hypothetical protein
MVVFPIKSLSTKILYYFRGFPVLVWIRFFLILPAGAQTYQEGAKDLGIHHEYGLGSTGGGVSFHDFDGDGWDDITLATEIGRPIYFYRNIQGEFIKIEALVNNLCESKQILWVDYDNDGDKDLYVTCFLDVNRLYRNDEMILTDVTEEVGFPLTELKTYGATWGDYDRDGWLDLYVTNKRTETEVNTNNLFRNLGNGTFEEVTLISQSGDPGKKPFSTSFIDINQDLYPDLYISQDKKAVNTLLKNMGDGSFTDISAFSGADLVMEGMSVAIGDYDNNHQLDMYITNIPEGNKLLRNNGDETFTEVAEQAGVDYLGYAWGANFLDFDQDGDLDLYVSGMQEGSDQVPSILYTNDGNGSFFIDELGFDADTVISFANAIGDIDNDGYPDIVVNNYSEYSSMLWKNSGGDHHWLKIRLEGISSNRDGLGSYIHVYYNQKEILHYTASGIGFLGQNSAYNMIGLGYAQEVDSIKVRWPSGQEDLIRQIQFNQSLIIREGSTRLPPGIYFSGTKIICEGDSVLLETGFYESYLWNSGQSTRKIYVRESGDYFVQVTDKDGRIAYSDTLSIEAVPIPEITFLTTPSENDKFNGTIKAQVNGGRAPYCYLWSVSGRDTSFVSGVGPGIHSLKVTDRNGCQAERTVEVETVTGLLKEEKYISLFPNPLSDQLYLRVDERSINQYINLKLWSNEGNLIESKKIKVTDPITMIPFQFHVLPSGLYLIHLIYKGEKYVYRIVII